MDRSLVRVQPFAEDGGGEGALNALQARPASARLWVQLSGPLTQLEELMLGPAHFRSAGRYLWLVLGLARPSPPWRQAHLSHQHK